MENDNNSFWSSLYESKTATPSAKTPQVKSLQPVNTPAPTPVAAPKLPRYLDGDFIQSIWNTESGGAKNDAIFRNNLVGDKGKAKGLYQQHEDYVQTANQINDRKRRIEAQAWADKNAPGWKNLKSEDGKKYQQYLDKLPKQPFYTSADRTDFAKQTQIYSTVMPWAVENFKRKFGRDPNEKELAMLHNVGGDMKQFGNAGNLKYAAAFEKHKVKPQK